MAMKPSITIVGAGNVASVLAPALYRAGYRVFEIVVRDNPASIKRAKALARKAGATATTLENARFSANVIWICVTDDAISSVARTMAKRRDVDWKNKVVLHASGALTSDELNPLKNRGAIIASAHFMQTFSPGFEPTLAVPLAVEGDKKAESAALKIGRALGARPFVIRKASKVLYHAMGSLSSPMVIASLSLAEELGRTSGLSSEQIRSVIGPIFSRTAENFLKKGTAAAFGGPISRGDVATLTKHLRELKKLPEARAAYLALGTAALNRLPVKNRKLLEELFRKG